MRMRSQIFAASDDVLSIDFLLLHEFSLLSFASAVEPLRAANRVSGRTLYRWRVLSSDGAMVLTSSGLQIAVDGAFEPQTTSDTLVVVAAFNVARHAGPSVMKGLRQCARRRLPLGGVESGAFVLAMAGVLAGRRATTHWEDLATFSDSFPDITVSSSRYVVDGDRFTSGGASPTLDMMLDLIRLRQGYGLALSVASVFIYERAHAGEDPQPSLSLGRLDWFEPRLAAAIRLIESQIDEPQTISALSARLGISRRTLETLFVSHVGQSPQDFVRGMRLEAARRLVLESRDNMTSVATNCGFQSASAFARAFRHRYGTSPSQARKAHRGW
jgi:transcriptional regulator GlxA family with amidase domain